MNQLSKMLRSPFCSRSTFKRISPRYLSAVAFKASPEINSSDSIIVILRRLARRLENAKINLDSVN